LLAALISPVFAAEPAAEPAASAEGAGEPAAASEQSATTRAPVAPDESLGPGEGVAYSKVFKETGSPFTNGLKNITIPFRTDPKIGPIEGRDTAMLPIPRLRARLPFLRAGQEPENAQFRIGPFYIRFMNVTVGLLGTDNGNLEEEDREAGVIAVLRSGVIVKAQLAEGLQINLSGAFTALPFQGSAGWTGIGLLAPFSAGVDEPGPLMRGQLVYDTRVGGWDLTLADDYQLNFGGFHDSYQDGILAFEGFDYYDTDQVGRYSFSPVRRGYYRDDVDRQRTSERENLDRLYFSNVVSANVERLMTNGVRLRGRLFHEDLWYNQGARGLPSNRDSASLFAGFERENMRFRPWAEYRTSRIDGRDGLSQAIRVGIAGPITDQLNLFAYGGAYRSSQDRTSFVGGIRFRHIAGPYTRQSLGYVRDVDEFEDEIHDSLYYTLSQTIGPRFVGQLAARYGYRESLDTGTRWQTWSVGARLWYVVGPRARLGGGIMYGDNQGGERLAGHLEYEQHFTDLLSGRLAYRYHQLHSSTNQDSYYENVVYLSLTQHFP
jgi:hypothetical protein